MRVAGHCALDITSLTVNLDHSQPDILLLDLAARGQRDIESLSNIRERTPKMRFMLLTDEPRPNPIEDILHNRFHGLLLSKNPPDVHLRAIRAVARGEIWVPRIVVARALSGLLEFVSHNFVANQVDAAAVDRSDAYTSRQQEIIDLVRKGLSNKEIAVRLGIVEDTVKKHLQHVYNKVGVHRRTLLLLNQNTPQTVRRVSSTIPGGDSRRGDCGPADSLQDWPSARIRNRLM